MLHPANAQQTPKVVSIPPPGAGTGPKLLDRVRHAIRTRYYSSRTEEAYVHWIRRYIVFHEKKHPSTLGAADISRFLTWLAVARRVSASTQNQALSAVLFLYRELLAIEVSVVPPVVRARTPDRLPVVLSRDEIGAILQQLAGTARLMVMLLYGSGLRLDECLELRVKDLDFDRQQIIVRQGKGQKDRVTMLPAAAEATLKRHLADVRRLHEADLARGIRASGVAVRAAPQVSQRIDRVAVAVRVSCGADLSRSALRIAVAVPCARVGGSESGRASGAAR